MASSSRVWSLIALTPDKRTWGGNIGYEDELASTYRYNAAVANHKQLTQGDLVLIRNTSHLLGIAQIERIEQSETVKTQQRCPECGEAKIKSRKNKVPLWRCKLGHEFLLPMVEEVPIMGYEAHYGDTYISTPGIISAKEIKSAAFRPNDQLSIEELDLKRIEKQLLENFPTIEPLLARFLDGVVVRPDEASGGRDSNHGGDEEHFLSSMCDTRNSILMPIKLRRGQKRFRDKLIERYGARCMISGCSLIDIVEAAHIDPYRGERDNHPENGLLLRADIHTLFDLNLMALHPVTLEAHFHPSAMLNGYREFEGKAMGAVGNKIPAQEPLARRWEIFSRILKNGK